jgi:CRP-like cAMP-binding protein
MVPLEDLKTIYLMQRLTDPLLEKVRPMVESRFYEDRDVIFREGEKAQNFFMLLKGKILLEVQASEAMMIVLGAVKAGYSFGWSGLIPGEAYTTYAIAAEPSEVLVMEGGRFLALMEKDHAIGFRIMQGVVNILKKRLERRTDQFLRTLRRHPDIQNPFWA